MINIFKTIYSSLMNLINKNEGFLKELLWETLSKMTEEARSNQKEKNKNNKK